MLSIETKFTNRLIKFLSVLYIATTKYQNVNALTAVSYTHLDVYKRQN